MAEAAAIASQNLELIEEGATETSSLSDNNTLYDDSTSVYSEYSYHLPAAVASPTKLSAAPNFKSILPPSKPVRQRTEEAPKGDK